MSKKKVELTRRRVLGGLGTIGVAGAAAGLGTSALFTDDESFTNNTITAGELDLFVDYWEGENTNTSTTESGTRNGGASALFSLTDVKPGDDGWVVFCPKIVDNPAYLWAGSNGLTEYENGLTEPEAEVDNTGGDPGAGFGELADNIQVSLAYCDYDGDGDRPDEEDIIRELDNPDDYTLTDLLLELQTGFRVTNNQDGTYPASDSTDDQAGPCLCIEWEVPTSVDNVIQSDSVEFDIEFDAVQSRNVTDPTQQNPFTDAILTSDATGGIRETDNWITAYVRAGPTTVINVELDGEVYGGGNSGLGEWPSNENTYFMEANIDVDNDSIDEAANDDDFRVGYGAANSGARAGAISNSTSGASGDGGYIRRNTGGPNPGDNADRTDVAGEDVPGFSAYESADQLSYTFVIDWSQVAADSDSPTAQLSSAPTAIQMNEVFGGDGGEGVGATSNSSNDGRGDIDNVADGSGTLTL